MSHPETDHPVPDVLLDLALRVLPAREAALAREHLAECAECAQRFARLEEEQAVLRQVLVASPAAPAGLDRAIRASLTGPGASWWNRGLALAAAGLLVAGLALVLNRPPETTKQAMLRQLRVSELKALGLDGGTR